MENKQFESPKLSHLESTPPPPSIPPITPPRKPKTLILILSLITLVSLTAAAYFYYQSQLTSPTLPISTPETYPSPHETSQQEILDSSTANWPTHAEIDFSFKYPPNWYLTRTQTASPLSLALTPDPYSSDILLDAPRQEGIYIHYNWTYNQLGNPIRQFQSISDLASHQLSQLDPSSVNRTDYHLSGFPAITLQGITKTDNPWTNNQPIHSTYIQTNQEILVISLSGDYQEIYSQLLSTFEFTD